MKFTMHDVIRDNNPLIREKSKPVTLPLSKEDREILQGLYDYINASVLEENQDNDAYRPAVGIAAIQVGIKKRMLSVVLDEYDKNDNLIHHEYALANPEIISSSIQKSCLRTGEGCLSVEETIEGQIYRHARIKIKAYNLLTDKTETIRARGFLAVALQHEIDHLDGILFYDHLKDPQPKNIDEVEIIG